MKKLFIILMVFVMIPINISYGAYTLDTIYGSYDDEQTQPKEPYFLHNDYGFNLPDPVEIILSKTQIYFHMNENEGAVSINAQTMPINSKHTKITYSSSDETVATVDENGNVSSKNKLGSAIITAKSGKLKTECRVDVIIGVTGVSITPNDLTLYADRPTAAQLTAQITPGNAGIKDVTWETTDASIASVDRTGVVTPSGVGTVTITATTKDKQILSSAKVTVKLYDGNTTAKDGNITYSKYNYTLEEATNLQLEASPTVFTTDAYDADRIDVENYITPSYLTNDDEKYQFIDLSQTNGVDAEVLDRYLNNKGILEGTGDVFLSAAEQNNISEVYLVIHACLETGNGTSKLSQGVDYNGETVYNMFGIGAVDASPLEGGASYAYSEGWTSIEDAIYGGAEWISQNYINNSKYKQNTLYKMRWNPKAPGNHQYATDVAWASKQAQNLRNMFSAFPSAVLSFDYPLYKGEQEEKIDIHNR